MAKETPAPTGDQNPVVYTFKTAFSRVRRDMPYVSHGIIDKKKREAGEDRKPKADELPGSGKTPENGITPGAGQMPENETNQEIGPMPAAGPMLESSNHGFYIGKIIRQSTGEKIRKLFGWSEPSEPIYGEEFIVGSLDYLFQHLKPGEKVQVIVCRVLSEIFNGQQDVQNALSLDDEVALIYKIAAKKFNKGKDQIEVINLENQPQHSELFESLRSSVNPDTGEFEVEGAFGAGHDQEPENKTDGSWTSLKIAQCLHRAMQEDDRLMKRFKQGIPKKLKDHGDQDLPKSYYSLTEIAIRLSEMLNGRVIHAGTNRQAVYDDVIEAFIKGNRGPFKGIKALQPLFAALEDRHFETLHIDNKKNYYRLRGEKKRAISRLAAAGILGLTTIITPPGVYHYQKMRERAAAAEAVRDYVRNKIKGVEYNVGIGSFRVEVGPEKIEELMRDFSEEVAARYGIPGEKQDEMFLGELFRQYIVGDDEQLRKSCEKGKYFVMAVDSFIRNNIGFLMSHGINITRPYDQFTPYLEYFIEAADKEVRPVSINLKNVNCAPQVGDCVRDMRTLTDLGRIEGYDSNYEAFNLHLLEDNGRKYLVARDYTREESLKKYGLEDDKIANTSKARRAARVFVTEMKRYDINALMDWESLFDNLDRENRLSNRYVPENIEEEQTPEPYLLEKSRIYKDYFDAFDYEIIKNSYHDPATNSYPPCLKARIPGQDINFSIGRAREAAVHFSETLHKDSFYDDKEGY